MQIKFECENCGQHLTVEESSAGQAYVCPNCNQQVEVPRRGQPSPQLVEQPPPAPPTPPSAPHPRRPEPEPEPAAQTDIYPVTIVDINMKFGSMVKFMIKWALASIPACLVVGAILFLVGLVCWLLFAVFAAGGTALLKH